MRSTDYIKGCRDGTGIYWSPHETVRNDTCKTALDVVRPLLIIVPGIRKCFQQY